jgi:hypothetical protein
MPYTEVMPKFKRGELHSGSKTGPVVTKRKQAIAIMLDEEREAKKGKKEYKPVTNHSEDAMKKRVKKYDEGGPVSSAKADELPNPPSFAGRVSAGKDPDVQTDSDNKITGRIKASAYNKGGAVKGGWRRW